MLWKLGLESGLDLELHSFSILHGEQLKRAPYLPRISRKVNLTKRTHQNDQQQNKITYSRSA